MTCVVAPSRRRLSLSPLSFANVFKCLSNPRSPDHPNRHLPHGFYEEQLRGKEEGRRRRKKREKESREERRNVDR